MSNPTEEQGSLWTLALPSQTSSDIRQLYELMASKHVEEMDSLKEQHAMWQANMENHFDQQMKKVMIREEPERTRTAECHQSQMEELKGFYSQQLQAQGDIHAEQLKDTQNMVKQLQADVSDLRRQLEIAHQQGLEKDSAILGYKTQLIGLNDRCIECVNRAEQADIELVSTQSVFDQLREENRKLRSQLEKVPQDLEHQRLHVDVTRKPTASSISEEVFRNDVSQAVKASPKLSSGLLSPPRRTTSTVRSLGSQGMNEQSSEY
ncbi:uncharacterized protein EV154DRAFT_486172 [Mucor mucedo]|uniref:uncharacterized protein n=1 Tax=Mucor mucedo TaxID=29922 RepID=UPI002221084D|nr:uncharacterized protein EV154DRAFT_486172 [Mucor mucedo]KAI7878539.1 hypothetical protein EV154DRAFT_486172 [Mucor mucedo]